MKAPVSMSSGMRLSQQAHAQACVRVLSPPPHPPALRHIQAPAPHHSSECSARTYLTTNTQFSCYSYYCLHLAYYATNIHMFSFPMILTETQQGEDI